MPVSESMTNGRRGQIAATGAQTDSKLADAAMPAGVLVVEGATSDDHCKVPATAAEVQKALGVAVYLPSLPMIDGSNEYAQDDEVSICEKGSIFVISEEAVNKNDDVYVRFATGTGTQLGAFRNDDDTTTCEQLVNAKFDETTSAAGVVRIKLSMPQ